MVTAKQVVWPKPQTVSKRVLGQGFAEYGLILAFVTTTPASATITVGHQLYMAFASVATALHP